MQANNEGRTATNRRGVDIEEGSNMVTFDNESGKAKENTVEVPPTSLYSWHIVGQLVTVWISAVALVSVAMYLLHKSASPEKFVIDKSVLGFMLAVFIAALIFTDSFFKTIKYNTRQTDGWANNITQIIAAATLAISAYFLNK